MGGTLFLNNFILFPYIIFVGSDNLKQNQAIHFKQQHNALLALVQAGLRDFTARRSIQCGFMTSEWLNR
jgi:hypothetical protein